MTLVLLSLLLVVALVGGITVAFEGTVAGITTIGTMVAVVTFLVLLVLVVLVTAAGISAMLPFEIIAVVDDNTAGATVVLLISGTAVVVCAIGTAVAIPADVLPEVVGVTVVIGRSTKLVVVSLDANTVGAVVVAVVVVSTAGDVVLAASIFTFEEFVGGSVVTSGDATGGVVTGTAAAAGIDVPSAVRVVTPGDAELFDAEGDAVVLGANVIAKAVVVKAVCVESVMDGLAVVGDKERGLSVVAESVTIITFKLFFAPRFRLSCPRSRFRFL